ncbi:LOW QUALITY PROTEIN: uncharacterized protein LOC129590571 [Paramacrobiotus metropolitanus]|uniref:LOW QUALITY PROTEIN: uncharacterized protein LOC129590571 n=1 Tax=Paramacrobiotus metropolitanus TaxID=2943436 RepID=UPI0024464CEF|nr:LOW QUALITY PROTEIN: uncharacterized protein LOC129590571 [Paramacrobiotus metropolitanus]
MSLGAPPLELQAALLEDPNYVDLSKDFFGKLGDLQMEGRFCDVMLKGCENDCDGIPCHSSWEIVRALSQNPTEAEVRKYQRQQHYKSDQRISFDVFLPILHEFSRSKDPYSYDSFIEGLRHFDTEGNGMIKTSELHHLLTTLGDKLSERNRGNRMAETDSEIEVIDDNDSVEDFLVVGFKKATQRELASPELGDPAENHAPEALQTDSIPREGSHEGRGEPGDIAEVSVGEKWQNRLSLYNKRRAFSETDLRIRAGTGRGIFRATLVSPEQVDPEVVALHQPAEQEVKVKDVQPDVPFCFRCKQIGHWTKFCEKKRLPSPRSRDRGRRNKMFWASERQQKERLKQDRALFDEKVRLTRQSEDLVRSQMRLQEDSLEMDAAQRAHLAAMRLLEDKQLRSRRDQEDLRVREDRIAEDREISDTFLERHETYMGIKRD